MKTHTIFPFLLLRVSLVNKGSRYIFFSFLLFFLLLSPLSAQQLINNKGNRNQSYPVITETNPDIVALINQVSQDSIESHIRYMQQFHRIANTPAAFEVQNYLVNQFESYGYEDISLHTFYCPPWSLSQDTIAAANVVVLKKGLVFPDEYIIICGHYDTYDGPGADCNASGTAGILECARLLKDFPTKRSIIFVPFNATEMYLVGSHPFAEMCAAKNMNILGVFNLDMIGFYPEDMGNITMGTGYSYISKNLFDYYSHVANLYLPNIPTFQFSFGDEHGEQWSFHIFGYPGLYIGDTEYLTKNPYVHTLSDTLGSGVNRLDLAKAFVQAVISATAELANAWLPPQKLSACQGIDKITVSWDNDGESSSYKIFKNNVLLEETKNNFYEDYDVELENKYEYFVIAVNGTTGKETAPSNKDKVTFVAPLQLPYSNDFKVDKYGFEQTDWALKEYVNKSTLCNASGYTLFPDNYLSIAELDWFSIPNNIENISISFKWAGNIVGEWYQAAYIHKHDWNNAGMWFEVTNDRKTWHKLAYISGKNNSWIDCEFSLNDYIGSDFFQARFRLESSGHYDRKYTKRANITDVEIVFTEGNGIGKYESPYLTNLFVSPNPTTGIVTITTFQENDYQISVYDLMGKQLFQQDAFRDGSLDISFLAKGTYLVVASLPKHSVAKKLVVF